MKPQDNKEKNKQEKQPASERTEKLQPLEQFFVSQLQDIYYAERRINEFLEELAGAVTSEDLEDSVRHHQQQTARQVKRLEKIFGLLKMEAEEKHCESIEGLMREANEIKELTSPGTATRDAALIIGLQKIEHYEIASYGGLLELAVTMDLGQVADLLDKSLREEEEADQMLTVIAEDQINVRAEQEKPYSWQKGLQEA